MFKGSKFSRKGQAGSATYLPKPKTRQIDLVMDDPTNLLQAGGLITRPVGNGMVPFEDQIRRMAEGGLFGPGDGRPDVLDPKSPRFMIDQKMAMNWPGVPINELDMHNKPIKPGVPDTIAELSLRRGFNPSIQAYRPAAGQQAYTPTLEDFGGEDYNKTAFNTAQRLSAKKRLGGKMSKYSKNVRQC